uniref:Rho-GAP domain-containing protein n=1 Tax=Panagrolaimus sp. JU765 TaxID=591449 RepID=A0AC34Q5H6_9BILA
MMGGEQLHVLPAKKNFDVMPLFDESSLSSHSYSCRYESNYSCTSNDIDNYQDLSLTSTIADTSSAASSISFINFLPEKNYETTSQTLQLKSKAEADIDECMQAMLTTANELSCISLIDNNNFSMDRRENRLKQQKQNGNVSIFSNNSDGLSTNLCNDVLQISPTYTNELDSVNYSDVESLIQELDSIGCQSSTHQPTPKFCQLDDQYTTNGYVTLVRNLIPKNNQSFKNYYPLAKTTSWTSPPTRPPPHTASSMPGTPVLSRYKRKTDDLDVTLPIGDDGELFSNYDEKIKIMDRSSKEVPSKIMSTSLTLQRPTSIFPEARYTVANKRRQGLVMENPLMNMSSPSSGLMDSFSSLDVGSTLLQSSGIFDDLSSENLDDGPISTTRIDDLLDCSRKFLYHVQPCEKIDYAREKAYQKLTTFLGRPTISRFKAWKIKSDTTKDLKNLIPKHVTTYDPSNGLFGMPLHLIQAASSDGLPFPQFVVDILGFLRANATEVNGIFRRCGSQKNVHEMREICNKLNCDEHLPDKYKDLSLANDLSDLLKQYLRAIPQQLIPDSVTEILVQVFSRAERDNLVDILKYILLILPDENREALFYFFDFLGEISESSKVNLMTVENLAICTLPSIVAFPEQDTRTMSQRNRRKTVGAVSSKDAAQYKNVSNAISLFIQKRSEFKKLPGELLDGFKVSKKRRSGKDFLYPLKDAGDVAGLREFVANLFQEYEDNWKNWPIESMTSSGVLIGSREVKDACPLKAYRLQATVSASVDTVFRFIFNERKQWDRQAIASKRTVVDWDHKEDLKKIIFNTGLAQKDTLLVSVWENYHPSSGGAYFAERNCNPIFTSFVDPVKVYHNVFLICPFKNKTVINRIFRIDLKGRSSDWYGRCYREREILALEKLLALIKDSNFTDSTGSL